MKLLSLSLIPIGCVFLAQLAQSTPLADEHPLTEAEPLAKDQSLAEDHLLAESMAGPEALPGDFSHSLAENQPPGGNSDANRWGRIEIRYKGANRFVPSGTGRCISRVRGKSVVYSQYLSHRTRCVVYSDANCKKRVNRQPITYNQPGVYLFPNYGSEWCNTIGA